MTQIVRVAITGKINNYNQQHKHKQHMQQIKQQ